jgi:hypothetical protein
VDVEDEENAIPVLRCEGTGNSVKVARWDVLFFETSLSYVIDVVSE